MSTLSELLQSLPAAVVQHRLESQGEIAEEDRTRDADRNELRKLGGDVSASALPGPESDERAAFDKLERDVDTLLTSLAAADAATAGKMALIRAHSAELKRRLAAKRLEQKAVKPPVADKPPVKILKKLVGSSLKPDPDFSLKRYVGTELGAVLSLINSVVEQNASEKLGDPKKINPGAFGQLNNALATGWRGQIFRSVGFWITELGLVGAAFGAKWHVDEAVRCFDEIIGRLVKVSGTVGGKKLTWWEFHHDVEMLRGTVPFASNPNDKEQGGALATFQDLVYKMWKSGRSDVSERVERGLEVLDACDLMWFYRSGKDPLWRRGPRDRVIHPFTKGIIRFWQRRELAKAGVVSPFVDDNAALVEELSWLIDDSLKKLEAEIMFYDNGKYGECMTFAYNVLAATQPDKNGKLDNEDGYQPFVYVMHDALLFLELGMIGLGMFAEARTQRAMANTMHAGMADAPYTITLTNGQKYTGEVNSKGVKEPTFTWVDNCPVSERIYDGTKTRRNRREYDNGKQKRVLVTSASTDGTYFEPKKQIEAAGAGVALLHADDAFMSFAKREFLGEASRSNISFLVGYALRLGLAEGRFVWA